MQNFLVVEAHTSEFPEPITFARGTKVSVGERYAGTEGWDRWVFCEAPGQQGGWVPEQVIRMTGAGAAIAREDYTAKELDVREGDVLRSGKQLNGWLWCTCVASGETGWVPCRNVRPVD